MKKIFIFLFIICLSVYLYADINEFTEYCKEGNIKKIKETYKDTDINSFSDQGTTPLLSAIQHKNKNVTEFLISVGADVNQTDKYGATPLLESIRNYDFDIIKLLINSNADVNQCDMNNVSPLFAAVYYSQELAELNSEFAEKKEKIKLNKSLIQTIEQKKEIINLLLSKGSKVDKLNNEGVSPVLLSVINNNLTVFDIFVNNGFEINSYIGMQKTTPLCLSVIEKNDLFFKYIMSKGADINKPDSSGITPVYAAVISDDLSKLKVFSDLGVDLNAVINKEGDTALSESCKLGREKTVDFLLSKNVSINIKDKNGFTPVHDSVSNEKILELILQKGGDPNIRNNELESPLHLAVRYNKENSVSLLLKYGAELYKNADNLTPYDISVNAKNEKIISLLKYKDISEKFSEKMLAIKENNINSVSENIDEYINFKDNENNSSLYYSVICNNMEILKLLTEKNIDINNSNIAGITPLYASVLNNNSVMTELLLSKGADPNKANVKKISPLMLAVKNNNFDIAKLLIENGADINAKDSNNINILSYAYYYGNSDIINLLTEKKADFISADNDNNPPLFYLLKSLNKNNIYTQLENYINSGKKIDITDFFGQNALHKACQNELSVDVIKLLAEKIDVNSKDSNNFTPIEYSVIKGNVKIAEYLLSVGAGINSDKKSNLLHLFLLSKNYNDELFNLLIDQKIDINALSPSGTPLNIAISKNNINAVKLLIGKGADINKKGTEYPLFQALLNKNTEIVNILLDNKPDVNIYWNNKISPLLFAVKYFNFDIIRKIIDLESDINLSSEDKWSPLHIAIYNKTGDKNKIINYLLEKGADLTLQSVYGIDPMYNACSVNDKETAGLFQSKGANPKTPTKMQLTAIDVCRDRGYNDILKLFGEKEIRLKENEYFDNCNYKIKIVNIDQSLYDYFKYLIEEKLLNSAVSYSVNNDIMVIECSSSFVIGEITQIFNKIETADFKLKRISDPEKLYDIVSEVVYK